ncbi:MAG TPA: aminomethyl-transferring glycine dehydrogenase subunit GcvPB [Syntrophomonadaceae bacterium]|nr:aminomethyl-transferring glycine dehydrogenase subunit GcvPB [Syntrophomonadaceae bacterium]HPR93162.1 aminomethyl-transferring glycine dehydrogenase subunit GcvPB [Syntrophomonadaceae bacterium]
MTKLIFEKHVLGANTFKLPPLEVPAADLAENIPEHLLRETPPFIPSISEVELIRHYTELSNRAYGVDNGAYPLGSCTMKYSPKINEWAARLPGFAQIHPYQSQETVQGALKLLYDMGNILGEVTGMDYFTLQPAAGAHGEMTGIMMVKAYHNKRGDFKRTKIMVPDSAHGTNPATANVVGYDVIEIKSNSRGMVDIDDLKAKMSDEVAGLMLTNPNTLGLFEEEIQEIAAIVHEGGGLLYYDGANLNAIMGICRPGDMGFDVVHLNLHKTFSTPHGGGGPGSGPVGIKAFLADFLPRPVIIKNGEQYSFDYDRPDSIGKVKNFYGNFSVIVKAYTYILAVGYEGLKDACQQAVLNANYLRFHLQKNYHIPFNRLCKHEFVISARNQMDCSHVATLDIAKRLLDFGFHPPTIYFPLIVKEAMMIEPTETENRERLDSFIAAMDEIALEARDNPQVVKDAPHTTVIGRVDEVTAARSPIVKWEE